MGWDVADRILVKSLQDRTCGSQRGLVPSSLEPAEPGVRGAGAVEGPGGWFIGFLFGP